MLSIGKLSGTYITQDNLRKNKELKTKRTALNNAVCEIIKEILE